MGNSGHMIIGGKAFGLFSDPVAKQKLLLERRVIFCRCQDLASKS